MSLGGALSTIGSAINSPAGQAIIGAGAAAVGAAFGGSAGATSQSQVIPPATGTESASIGAGMVQASPADRAIMARDADMKQSEAALDKLWVHIEGNPNDESAAKAFWGKVQTHEQIYGKYEPPPLRQAAYNTQLDAVKAEYGDLEPPTIGGADMPAAVPNMDTPELNPPSGTPGSSESLNGPEVYSGFGITAEKVRRSNAEVLRSLKLLSAQLRVRPAQVLDILETMEELLTVQKNTRDEIRELLSEVSNW